MELNQNSRKSKKSKNCGHLSYVNETSICTRRLRHSASRRRMNYRKNNRTNPFTEFINETLNREYPRLSEMVNNSVITLTAPPQSGKSSYSLPIIWILNYVQFLKVIYLTVNIDKSKYDFIEKIISFNKYIDRLSIQYNNRTGQEIDSKKYHIQYYTVDKNLDDYLNSDNNCVIIGLANENQIGKILKSVKENPRIERQLATIFDEAHKIVHTNQEETTIKNEVKKREMFELRLDSFIDTNGRPQPAFKKILFITATSVGIYISDYMKSVWRTVCLNPHTDMPFNTRYISILDYNFIANDTIGYNSFKGAIDEDPFIQFGNLLLNTDQLQQLPNGFKQPHIALINVSRFTAIHNRIARLLARNFNSFRIVVMNSKNPACIFKLENGNIRTESINVNTPSSLLQYFKNLDYSNANENGNEDFIRKPIVIIGGAQMECSVSFMSTDKVYKGTYLMFHPHSKESTQDAIIQMAGRCAGQYPRGSIVPSIYTSSPVYNTIKNCLKNEKMVQEAMSNLRERRNTKNILKRIPFVKTDENKWRKFCKSDTFAFRADNSIAVENAISLTTFRERHIQMEDYPESIQNYIRNGMHRYQNGEQEFEYSLDGLYNESRETVGELHTFIKRQFNLPPRCRLNICYSTERFNDLNKDPILKTQQQFQTKYVAMFPQNIFRLTLVEYNCFEGNLDENIDTLRNLHSYSWHSTDNVINYSSNNTYGHIH